MVAAPKQRRRVVQIPLILSPTALSYIGIPWSPAPLCTAPPHKRRKKATEEKRKEKKQVQFPIHIFGSHAIHRKEKNPEYCCCWCVCVVFYFLTCCPSGQQRFLNLSYPVPNLLRAKPGLPILLLPSQPPRQVRSKKVHKKNKGKKRKEAGTKSLYKL